jgi:hypothetical protein
MECVHPSLDAQSMCTYSSARNTVESVCFSFGKQSLRTTQVRAKLNHNLVPMAHQPICTFTFSFIVGVQISDITVEIRDLGQVIVLKDKEGKEQRHGDHLFTSQVSKCGRSEF